MTDLRIDYTRADADRRMRLLEMAGGDLEKAREMELWVISGCVPKMVVIAGAGGTGVERPVVCKIDSENRFSIGDNLDIPPHLRRTA